MFRFSSSRDTNSFTAQAFLATHGYGQNVDGDMVRSFSKLKVPLINYDGSNGPGEGIAYVS